MTASTKGINLTSRLHQLGKDSLIYGIGGIAARSLSFFLLPILTRIFSPAEYGLIELLTAVIGLLNAVLALGMDSAQSFYFYAEKERGIAAQAIPISAIFQWSVIWGGILIAIGIWLYPVVNELVFGGRLDRTSYAFAIIGSLFSQLLAQGINIYRLLYRPWMYILINAGNSLFAAALTIWLAHSLGLGIVSFFIAFFASSVLFSVLNWVSIRSYLDLSALHVTWWPRVLKFGVPLVPAGLSVWIMNSTDRWFINYFSTPENLGLYSVGAKFSILIAFAVDVFRRASWPVALDAMHSPDGAAFFQSVARFYCGAGMAAVILLTATSPFIIGWFAAPEYHDAYPVIGILSFSSVFYGFLLISGSGVWKTEKTWWTAIALSAGAILNVLLNALLVPRYHGIGASVATSLAMLLSNIVLAIASGRVGVVRFPYGILLMQITVGGFSVFAILNVFARRISEFYILGISVASLLLLLFISVPNSSLKQTVRIVFARPRRR